MIVCVDFETTGLLNERAMFADGWASQPGIVQLAIRRSDGAVLSSLVNPECVEWSEKAMQVTGIRPEDVQDSPTLFALFPAVADIFVGATTWIGYNCEFDKNVLWYQLLRYGLEKHFPWPPQTIDVMELVRLELAVRGRKDIKSVKLGEAYEKIVGKEMINAHDAMADVEATWEIFKRLNAPSERQN